MVWCIVAEYQTLHTPVRNFLRAGEDAFRKQPVKTVLTEFITFLAGHTVQRICTFVAFVAGENIQIGAIQLDAVGENLGEVSSDVIRSLSAAQIGLRAASPSCMLWIGAIRKHGRISWVKGWSIQIIVAVLVMDTEHESQTMHGVNQRFHSFPAACFDTSRQIVRMMVVISRFSPTVQMQVHLSDTKLIEIFHLFFSCSKGGDKVILFRIFRIIEIRLWIYIGFDSAVNKGTANQIIDRRNPCSFFFQRSKETVLFDIVAVNLAQVVVVTVIQEGVFKTSAVVHLAKTWFPPGSNMGVRSVSRMFCVDTTVPWCGSNCNVTCAMFYLTEPRHISTGGEKLSVKRKFFQSNSPVVWNQQTLSLVEKGVIFLAAFFKLHITWPSYLLDGKILFANWNPFKVNGFVDLFYPNNGIKRVGICFAKIVSVGRMNSLSNAAAKFSMTDFFPLGKRNFSFFGEDGRAEMITPFPFNACCLDLISKCRFVQKKDDFSHR